MYKQTALARFSSDAGSSRPHFYFKQPARAARLDEVQRPGTLVLGTYPRPTPRGDDSFFALSSQRGSGQQNASVLLQRSACGGSVTAHITWPRLASPLGARRACGCRQQAARPSWPARDPRPYPDRRSNPRRPSDLRGFQLPKGSPSFPFYQFAAAIRRCHRTAHAEVRLVVQKNGLPPLRRPAVHTSPFIFSVQRLSCPDHPYRRAASPLQSPTPGPASLAKLCQHRRNVDDVHGRRHLLAAHRNHHRPWPSRSPSLAER